MQVTLSSCDTATFVATARTETERALSEIDAIYETAGRLIKPGMKLDQFDHELKGLEDRVRDLKDTLPASGDTMRDFEKQAHLSRVEEIAHKVDDLYTNIVQNATITDSADETLMMHAVKCLETILVDATFPKFTNHMGEQPVLKGEEITSHSRYSDFRRDLETLKGLAHPVSCFISYEWSNASFVHQLNSDLQAAGIKTCIDIDYGPEATRDLSKLESEIYSQDFVLVVGTKEYGEKCRSQRTSGVRDEAPLIESRYSRQRDRVIKILLSGTALKSFPRMLSETRTVYLGIKTPTSYYAQVITLLEKLYTLQLQRNAPLKEQLDELKKSRATSLPLLLSSSLSQPSPSLSTLIPSLQTFYQKFRYLERFIDMIPIPIEESFIQFALIRDEEKKEQGEQDHEMYKRNSFAEIDKDKKSISLSELFQSGKTRLLIEGSAGIGKSTLCQYISYVWTKPTLRQEKFGPWADRFEMVLFTPLRNLLQKDKNITWSQFLQQEFFSSCSSAEVERLLQTHKDKILYLLDGYDEIATRRSDFETFLNHFKNQPNWIFTSRPHYLTEKDLGNFLHFENIGFSDQAITQYIERFFNDYNASCHIQRVEELFCVKPMILALAHIPINLELLCCYLLQNTTANFSVMTLTSLYSELTLNLFRRFSNRKINKENDQILTFNKLQTDSAFSPLLKSLEEIAFSCVEQKSIIFSPILYLPIVEQMPLDKCTALFRELGFLKISGPITELTRASYHFIHLTFQEYFAARHLANLFRVSPERATGWVVINRFDRRCEIVLRFTAGLLSDHTEELNFFFNTLIGNPRSYLRIHELCLALCCFEEVRDLTKIKSYDDTIQEFAKFIPNNMDFDSKLCQNHVIPTLQYAKRCFSHQAIKGKFLAALNGCSSTSMKENLISSAYSIENCYKQFFDDPLCPKVNRKAYIRDSAIDALEKIKANDPQISSALIDILFEPDQTYTSSSLLEGGGSWFNLHESTVSALKVIKPNDQNTLAKLLRLLPHPEIGGMVEGILIAIKPQGPAIIRSLFQLLKSDEVTVRVRAAIILAVSEPGNPHLIPAIEKLLLNGNDSIRSTAARALCLIGSKNQQAVPLLVKLVSDKETTKFVLERLWWERIFLIERGINTCPFITALINALSNNSPLVRRPVVEILSFVGPNRQDVISALKSAVSDKDDEVSRKAVEGLNRTNCFNVSEGTDIVKTYLMKEARIFSVLLPNAFKTSPILTPLLRDENKKIRLKALALFREMSDLSQEAIFTLVTLLFEKDADIREAAAAVLEKVVWNSTEHVNMVIDSLISDRDTQLVLCAARSLTKTAPNHPLIIKALLDILSHERHFGMAVHAILFRYAPTDPHVVEQLSQELGNPIFKARYWAQCIFENRDPEIEVDIELLIKQLQEPKVFEAVILLASTQTHVLRILIEQLGNPSFDYYHQRKVSDVIKRIQPCDPEMILKIYDSIGLLDLYYKDLLCSLPIDSLINGYKSGKKSDKWKKILEMHAKANATLLYEQDNCIYYEENGELRCVL